MLIVYALLVFPIALYADSAYVCTSIYGFYSHANAEVFRIEREWAIYLDYHTESELKGFLKERKEERDYWEKKLGECEASD